MNLYANALFYELGDEFKAYKASQSVGGAIAVYTVANSPHKDQIRALIIDSAFSDLRIAREKLGQIFLTWPAVFPVQ